MEKERPELSQEIMSLLSGSERMILNLPTNAAVLCCFVCCSCFIINVYIIVRKGSDV